MVWVGWVFLLTNDEDLLQAYVDKQFIYELASKRLQLTTGFREFLSKKSAITYLVKFLIKSQYLRFVSKYIIVSHIPGYVSFQFGECKSSGNGALCSSQMGYKMASLVDL